MAVNRKSSGAARWLGRNWAFLFLLLEVVAFGLFGTSLGILSLPMPWIGGQLWQRLGPPSPFWVVVAAEVISIPIAWFKFRLPKRESILAK